MKLVDHMKVFKVDKLERIPNKTHDDFKKQIWDLEDHIATYKQLYALDIRE